MSSALAPRITTSAPAPVSIVVASPSGPSIRTVSSPPPGLTTIFVKVERSNAKSTVPSAPTSSSSVPCAGRKTSLSGAASPVTVSVPLATLETTEAFAAAGNAANASIKGSRNRCISRSC